MGVFDWVSAPVRGFVLTALIAGLVGVFTTLLSIGRPKVSNGWVVLRPTLLLYGVGILAIPLAVLFLTFGTLGLLYPPMPDMGPHPRLIAIGEVFFGLMFPYCAVSTFCVRVRFNEAGVEKSWFGRSTFIPWVEIRKFDRSFFRGPLIVTASGRGIPISEYLLGFRNLLATAQAKGVEVAKAFVA